MAGDDLPEHLELIERLKAGDSPEQIHAASRTGRSARTASGSLTAYAKYRLASATMERNKRAPAQKLSPPSSQQVTADYEVGPGHLPEPDGPDGLRRPAGQRPQAQQASRQAETAVRVAQERLRILGVKPDGTEPRVEHGQVVGVRSRRDASRPSTSGEDPVERQGRRDPAPRRDEGRTAPVDPVGSPPTRRSHADARPAARQHLLDLGPVRRHDPRPRDDRAGRRRRHDPPDLHPGRPLDGLGRGNVHESDFGMLARSRGARRSDSGRRPTPAASSRAR